MKSLLLLAASAAAFDVLPFQLNPFNNLPTPSSLDYVKRETLELYGLNGSYTGEPKQRVSFDRLVHAVANADYMYKELVARKGITEDAPLSSHASALWESVVGMGDEQAKEYLQWIAAHFLNLVFSARLVEKPSLEKARKMFTITHGTGVCSLFPNGDVHIRAEYRKYCTEIPTDREVEDALEVLRTTSKFSRFVPRLLNAVEKNVPVAELIKFELGEEDAGELLQTMLDLSPEFKTVVEGYLSLAIREYFEIQENREFDHGIYTEERKPETKKSSEEKEEETPAWFDMVDRYIYKGVF